MSEMGSELMLIGYCGGFGTHAVGGQLGKKLVRGGTLNSRVAVSGRKSPAALRATDQTSGCGPVASGGVPGGGGSIDAKME